MELIISVSDDPITGVKRKLHFAGLEIKKDLNMILTCDLVYYANENDKMVDYIQHDESLTRGQKTIRVRQFLSGTLTADTTGVWVDEKGNPVELVEKGEGLNIEIQYPEGSVPELEFWQNLSLSYFLQEQGFPEEMMNVLAQIKFSALFYGAIQRSMQNLDTRKRF